MDLDLWDNFNREKPVFFNERNTESHDKIKNKRTLFVILFISLLKMLYLYRSVTKNKEKENVREKFAFESLSSKNTRKNN